MDNGSRGGCTITKIFSWDHFMDYGTIKKAKTYLIFYFSLGQRIFIMLTDHSMRVYKGSLLTRE